MKKKPLKPEKIDLIKKRANRKLNTDNTDNFMDHGIDIENRVIHLFNHIDSETTGMAIKGIQLMLAKDQRKGISIFINSFGGCPYSAFGLYNYIRSLKTLSVKTFNIGCAMSAGSIIFMAGDERFMYEDTVFMFHSVSSAVEGKMFDIITEAEECKRIHSQICKIYSKNSNKTESQWNKLLEFKDRYYRAEEALNLGFVKDIILDNDSLK